MLRQGMSVYAVKAFAFRPDRKGGRIVEVAQGQEMWVTNTMHNQARNKIVCLAKPKQKQHYDYPFSFDLMRDLFGQDPEQA